MREFTLEELLDPGWVAPGDPEDHFRPGRGAYLVKLFSAGAPLWRECLRVAHLTTDQPASGAGEEGRGLNECSACGLTGYHAASVSSFHSREVGWVTRSLCSDCNQWGHTASAAGYRLSEDIAVIARKAAHVQRLIKYAQLTTDQPARE